MDSRARDIFRRVVESYLETGEPVGSRTISRGGLALSPASIRNTMQDLAQLGLLDAPHTSAGRMPTHAGLRMFVDGFLEVGDIGEDEKRAIEARLAHLPGPFALGEQPTLADICIVPQVFNARRFGVDLTPYKRIVGIDAAASKLDAFAAAEPGRQPDAE